MAHNMVICGHCRGSGWIRGPSRRTNSQTFETTVDTLMSNPRPFGQIGQGLPLLDQGTLSPGENRRATLYHQWSASDVWVSLLLAGVSGTLIGLSSIPICIAARVRWYWSLIAWTGGTTIVWGIKAMDFFKDDKAVVSSQEQERWTEPAPIVQEPPATEIVIKSADGRMQRRAKLRAPKYNPAGLWLYADALVKRTAAPSYEGGKHVLGAEAFGYSPNEFDGRSDKWRPTAIKGGILEVDPHKSKGYRLTEDGRRALAQVAKHRMEVWG